MPVLHAPCSVAVDGFRKAGSSAMTVPAFFRPGGARTFKKRQAVWRAASTGIDVDVLAGKARWPKPVFFFGHDGFAENSPSGLQAKSMYTE